MLGRNFALSGQLAWTPGGYGSGGRHRGPLMEHYIPAAVPAMRAARQQHGEVSFRAVNKIHVPAALVSMFLLPTIMLMGRSECSDLGLLAATIAIALLANAVVCGTLSNPHDRYGARLVWIATFTVALVGMRYVVTLRTPAGNAVKAARMPGELLFI